MKISPPDLLASLAPIGDHFFDHASRMAAAGFNSFEPLLAFQESFCSASLDVQMHRKFMIELAKERVANPYPHPYLRDDPPGKYRSVFLNELRASRARAGNSFETYDTSKRWLLELSPCRFAQMKLNITDPVEHDKRRQPYLEEHHRLRQIEIDTHATEMSRRPGFEKKDRVELCKAVLGELTSRWGFKYDVTFSRRPYLVFSKPLSLPWCLCWVLDDTQLHCPVGIRPEDQIGYLDLTLELRQMGETQMTKTRKTSNSSVRISYNYAAPIDGAEWGYGRFDTLSELETLIRANAFAYGTMNGFIEAELNAQLRR